MTDATPKLDDRKVFEILKSRGYTRQQIRRMQRHIKKHGATPQPTRRRVSTEALRVVRCTTCNKYVDWRDLKASYKNLTMCRACSDEMFGSRDGE